VEWCGVVWCGVVLVALGRPVPGLGMGERCRASIAVASLRIDLDGRCAWWEIRLVQKLYSLCVGGEGEGEGKGKGNPRPRPLPLPLPLPLLLL
jgi:hypothetical protein